MFGEIHNVKGDFGMWPSINVPIDYLQDLRPNKPIPVSISGTNNVVFNINTTRTNPYKTMIGDDFIDLNYAVSYDFSSAGNQLNPTTGAVESLVLATGIWYMYLGNVAGVLTLLPSTAVPSSVEGRYYAGSIAHPGNARTGPWIYVGIMICDVAATPTFIAMTKNGYTYGLAVAVQGEIATSATTYGTAIVPVDPTNAIRVIPGHGALGLKVGGVLECGNSAGDIIHIADDTTGYGEKRVVNVAADDLWVPFDNITPTAAGGVNAIHTTNAGDVHVTQIHDIV
jgi:hypothetical protein